MSWVRRLLIGPNAGHLAAVLGSVPQDRGGTPGVISASPPWLAVTVLIAYVVVFTTLSVVLVRRRDLP